MAFIFWPDSQAQAWFMKNTGDAQTNLSGRAKSIQRAREVALNTPDIRKEKVNDVRAEIAEGRFQIDSEAVAGKILQDILVNSKFLE